MGKQEKKQSKTEKNGKKNAPKFRQECVEKTPGPRPESYAPNAERTCEQERNEFARRIVEARSCFDNLVDGVHGTYLVGVTTPEPVGHLFKVKNFVTETTPPVTKLVIEGDVLVYGFRVCVPHKWLFLRKEEIRLDSGRLGQVQADMLDFLRGTLADAIADAKQRRYEEKKAEEARQREAEARECRQNFVTATPGDYTILGKDGKLCDFTVYVWSTDGASYVRGAECDGGAYVPHEFIFRKEDECYFADGRIGKIQRAMRTFLIDAMGDDLESGRAAWVASRKPSLRLVTSDGNATDQSQEKRHVE